MQFRSALKSKGMGEKNRGWRKINGNNGTATSGDRDPSRHAVKYIFYNRPLKCPAVVVDNFSINLSTGAMSRCSFFFFFFLFPQLVRSTLPLVLSRQKLSPISGELSIGVFSKSVQNSRCYTCHLFSSVLQWISTILCHRVKYCPAMEIIELEVSLV